MLPPRSCLTTLLSEHPAHSVRHVALAAAVRSNNAGDPVVEIKSDFIRKGLKALNLDIF